MSESRPRVVHVVATDAFAGVERYLTYIAPGLVAAGWDVTVVGGDQGRMTAAFEGSGVVHVPHTGLSGTWRWLRTNARTAAVVHTHMTAADFVAVRALPRSGPRLVTTRHFAAGRGSTVLARVATRGIPRRMAAQIAISRFVADAIDEPTVVIPNGVPAQPFGAHDRPIVFVAQRLEAEKGTDLALRAWAASGLAARGWSLHVAGDGAERGRLERLSVELGTGESVRFLGLVDDVADRMAASGMVLATAPTEPFGLSVAEAMATGATVLAAAGGAHRELLADDAGVLVAAGDADAMADAMSTLVDSPARRVEIGRRAQARQRAEYSVDVHVSRLDRLYRSLLGG